MNSPEQQPSDARDGDASPFTASKIAHANSPATDRYWSQCLFVVFFILGVWAFISLGCGILFREILDAKMPNVGNAPFGFWMAQQGAIIGFLILLVVYMVVMNRLDRRHGFNEDDAS